MTVKLSIIQTMRLNYLLAPPCCQAWFYVSSSRQWDWMTSWHHVARHCSMCHHPDNETEWPHGTALLPDMVLCVIIQTMRLNDLLAPPCCQAWSMCHHPDNETEWSLGTALLPGMGCLCLVNHCANIIVWGGVFMLDLLYFKLINGIS